MIIERSEHPTWLSNAYLVADDDGGSGVLVDSNGVADALHDQVAQRDIRVTHVLVTHSHPDHVVDVAALGRRYGVAVLAHPLAGGVPGVTGTINDDEVLRSGPLAIRVIATPGHCPDHVALLVNDADCFTADCLFAGTVGGTAGGGATGYTDQVHSIMQRLMSLDPHTRIHPGHCGASTIAAEWDQNPFIRVWRGVDAEGSEPCRVRGQAATLIVWGPDYDGTHKAWVRYADGRDAIVGGSQVER